MALQLYFFTNPVNLQRCWAVAMIAQVRFVNAQFELNHLGDSGKNKSCLFRRNIVYYIYTHMIIYTEMLRASQREDVAHLRGIISLSIPTCSLGFVLQASCIAEPLYINIHTYIYIYDFIIYNIIMSMMSMCSGSKCVVRYRYATHFINTVDGRNPAPVGRWFIYVYMPF